MNPASPLIPPLDPFGLPAPVWVFVLLLNATLTVHFALVGYVFTCALTHVFLALGASEGSAAQWMLRATERPLPAVLSFAITLGVAPLLFIQVLYQPLFYTSTILLGHQWFGIVPLLLGGFYLIHVLYGGRFLGRRIPRWLEVPGRLAIFGSIAYVLATQTSVALLALHPERWLGVREAGGTTFQLRLPILWPRLAHNTAAALVVGSLWLITLGRLGAGRAGSPEARENGRQLAKLGGLVGFVAILLGLISGLWLMAMDGEAVGTLLGSLRPATLLWLGSLGGIFALFILLILTLMMPGKRWPAVLAWGALLGVLGGMFAGREAVREITLGRAGLFRLEAWTVVPQRSSLIFFLVLFALALGVLALLGRWALQARQRAKLTETYTDIGIMLLLTFLFFR